MSRRANAAIRCPDCKLHASLCLCDLISPIATKTKLVLIIHRSEVRKPTNTGLLAAKCLTNSQVLIRGNEGAPSEALAFDTKTTRPLLLFPHDDVQPLESVVLPNDEDTRPFTLIVPDGNWRQASKVRARVPGLKDVPCVKLPVGEPSIYRLRSEAHPSGLATIEAIARTMEILEGRFIRDALEAVFRPMVERTLWARGSLAEEHVTGGIPVGAEKHDPTSGILGAKRRPHELASKTKHH